MKRVQPALPGLALVLFIGFSILIIWADLQFHWTGYSDTTTPLTQEQIVERQKTIWDWLELLLIPTILAGGGLWFSRSERRNEHRNATERAERELQIADENAQEAALEAYLEKMSTLLLAHGLFDSPRDHEVRDIARAWTLTILRRVKGERKGVLLRFLHESALILCENNVISLDGADLRGADLREADLRRADLSWANLNGANLLEADLRLASLCGVDLRGAHLEEAHLEGCTYDGATRWPEGFDQDAAGVFRAGLHAAHDTV